jgi:hypothetical protein
LVEARKATTTVGIVEDESHPLLVDTVPPPTAADEVDMSNGTADGDDVKVNSMLVA